MQRRLNCNLWGPDNAGRPCKAEGAGVAEVKGGGSQSPAGPEYPASQDCSLAHWVLSPLGEWANFPLVNSKGGQWPQGQLQEATEPRNWEAERVTSA